MSTIGNKRLGGLLNKAIKQFFGVNRPFITVVIEPNSVATVHSNMDQQHERIQLLESIVKEMKKAN